MSAKRYVVGLDSEDDGAGTPFLWALVHRHGHVVVRSRDRALEALSALRVKMAAKGYRLEVWTTNLEYELVNLFDAERIAQVTLRFGRAYLCSACWRSIDFRDTMRHLPASVKELGEMVGLPKLEETLFNGERPDPVRDVKAYESRCVRDAAITYRAAVYLQKSYRALGVRARTTLASTALALWRERYWQREVVRPYPLVWNAAHLAYHGGRAQALAVGTFSDVSVIDVASMFPWAMTTAPLPLPWGMVGAVQRGGPITGNGLFKVRVHSSLQLPLLPVRTSHGTVYPNGTWTGWYVGEELKAFQRAGGVADVLEGYRFLESCEPFGRYVGALFKRKQAARGLKRQLYKTLLNGLYGKFGQQGRIVRCVNLEKWRAMARRPLDAREWNGLILWETESAPPPWSNQVWASFITARARVRLAERIRQLQRRGARPLYCDTDSVMYTGDGGRVTHTAKRAGDWELKGRYARLLLVGKKEYALETEPGKWLSRAKGVPLLARYRYLTEGVATFQRPTRLREGMRTGAEVNVWREREKRRRVDLKRASLPDGSLPHPVITEGGTESGNAGD